VPRHLRRPIARGAAESALRARLEQRSADFLALLRDGVYGNPASPYRTLLAHAGCELGDVALLIRDHGVEGALRAFLRAGIYLTADELKGYRPIIRGSLEIEGGVAHLRNPAARPGVPYTSSGSRGPGTRIDADLDFLWEGFTDQRLFLEARGGLDWRPAVWGVPGGTTVALLLAAAASSRVMPQFFSRLDLPAERGLPWRYAWSVRVLRAALGLAGRRLPAPLRAPLADPAPLVRWLGAVRARGETPHVLLYASAAVRLGQAAAAMGTDLEGVQLLMSGEPVTPARRAAVERLGARAVPLMGSTEIGTVIGLGCLSPEGSDDMHLLHDLLAVIQPDQAPTPAGLAPGALLVSAIRPRAALLLLNASLRDYGTLSDRVCGCKAAAHGWRTHLTGIRSHEKLTAGGMTLYDSALERVLEETLPDRFGGGPLDYQLVEEEAADGSPVLRLLVHPALGPIDSAAVEAAFLDAVGKGGGVQQLIEAAWRRAGFLRVERRPPEATPGGKIQHLHSAHRSPAGRRS
jgi:hypothetical protein